MVDGDPFLGVEGVALVEAVGVGEGGVGAACYVGVSGWFLFCVSSKGEGRGEERRGEMDKRDDIQVLSQQALASPSDRQKLPVWQHGHTWSASLPHGIKSPFVGVSSV